MKRDLGRAVLGTMVCMTLASGCPGSDDDTAMGLQPNATDGTATNGTTTALSTSTGTASTSRTQTAAQTSSKTAAQTGTGSATGSSVNLEYEVSSSNTCDERIVMHNPFTTLSMDAFVVQEPAALQQNPKAGRPEYVYLNRGKDGVRLPGPTLSGGASSLLDGIEPQLIQCTTYSQPTCFNEKGYRLVMNSRLAIVIAIDDWEDEVAMGDMELCRQGDALTTSFVFLGHPQWGGVAHPRMTAIVDGVQGPTTPDIPVESR